MTKEERSFAKLKASVYRKHEARRRGQSRKGYSGNTTKSRRNVFVYLYGTSTHTLHTLARTQASPSLAASIPSLNQINSGGCPSNYINARLSNKRGRVDYFVYYFYYINSSSKSRRQSSQKQILGLNDLRQQSFSTPHPMISFSFATSSDSSSSTIVPSSIFFWPSALRSS